MIRLFRLFSNPFMDDEVSFMELLNCATDTHQRLIANNPGALYNVIINGLTVAISIVDQCATDDLVKLGLRKSAKEAKNIFRKALPEHIANIYVKFAAHVGVKSPLINALLPAGREVFNTCQDDDLSHHLATIITNLAPHVASMGAAGTQALNDANGLLSVWIGLFAASETSTGNKTTTEKEKRAAKENLAAKLHVALLTIALQQASDASALSKAVTIAQAETTATLYFRQDLLQDPATPEEEEEEPTEDPAPTP